MLLQTEFSDDARVFYNGLPGVQEASDQLLATLGFPDFLQGFGDLAARHGLCDVVGAFLLHRHFSLRPGQIMNEAPLLNQDGSPELVTRPTPVEVVGNKRPTRWGYGADFDVWSPLEFSEDVGAISAADKVLKNDAFVSDYMSLLERFELYDHLGLCVTARSHLERRADDVILETTSDAASIVRLRPRSGVDFVGTLTTVWAPCATKNQQCVPTYYCEWFCWKADDDHGRGHRQRKGPHEQV